MGGIVIGKDARIALLEREVDRLSKQLDTLVMRQFLLSPSNQVFLATTTTSGTYPSAGANTFEFQFLDFSFTATAGTQSLTSTARASSPTHVGYSPSGYIDEDTIVFAVRLSNSTGAPQYILIQPGGGGGATGSIAKVTTGFTARTGTTVGTGTVTLYSISSGTLTAGTTGVSVNNWTTATPATDTWVWIDKDESGDWVLVSEDCG